MGMKYCSKCGNELMDEAVICTKCGCMIESSTNKVVLEKSAQSVTESSNDNTNAVISLIMGIVSVIFAFIFIWTLADGYGGIAFIGNGVLLSTIIGMYLGLKAKLSNKNTMGMIGFILSSAILFVTLVTTVILYFSLWW